MAEFCLACWKRLNERADPPERYWISKDPELCEGCVEWKRVIVKERLLWQIRHRRKRASS